MTLFRALVIAAVLASGYARAAEDAPVAIPKGDLSSHAFDQSRIFPGTKRTYTLYVPKQYDPAKPACVYVNQDGVGFNAPAVFDRLIHEKAMPVTVGVFVTPGNASGRGNRSFEYDAMTDDYVRFLSEELLPYIAKTHKLNLSTDGNDRAIAGTSSGGICAFTAAWERPDAFRRVFSNVGSFGAHRGGYVYPILVRKVEPKPIRVFLARRLQRPEIHLRRLVAGQPGDGTGADVCRLRGGTLLGPGRPRDDVCHESLSRGHALVVERLAPADQGGRRVAQSSKACCCPANRGRPWPAITRMRQAPTANAKGEVFFCDAPADKTYKVDLKRKQSTSSWPVPSMPPAWRAARKDCFTRPQATGSWRTMPRPRPAVVADDIRGHRLAVGANGNLYATSRAANETEESKLWLVTRGGREARRRRRSETRRWESRSLPTGGSFASPTAASTRSTVIGSSRTGRSSTSNATITSMLTPSTPAVPTACAPTGTAAFTWRRRWGSKSARRPARPCASSRRPTARFPACASAVRSSIRSTRLVAIAYSSAKLRVRGAQPWGR